MPFDMRMMRSIIYVDCVREEYRHRLLHWLYAMHVPDSISKFGPYVTKYAFYNALPVPPEGERFGTRRMQMTEHYWLVNEMLPEMRVNAFTERMPVEVLRWQGMIPDDGVDLSHAANMDGDTHRASGGGEMPPFVFAHVPINWEEDFKGAGRTPEDGPNYRWQFLLQYPEGVSKEDGEKWFYDEVVPYFQKSVFVNRFVSSKVKINYGAPSAKFDRLCEIWFEGPEEWYQAAVVLADRMIKKPDWAEQEHFPYLKPQFNIASMFLGDRATSDNLTQYRGFITMR